MKPSLTPPTITLLNSIIIVWHGIGKTDVFTTKNPDNKEVKVSCVLFQQVNFGSIDVEKLSNNYTCNVLEKWTILEEVIEVSTFYRRQKDLGCGRRDKVILGRRWEILERE